MLSMEMDAVDITNIIKVHFSIPSQKNTQTQTDAHAYAHTLLIQHSVNEDGSQCLAGVAVFHKCKVTCLSEH